MENDNRSNCKIRDNDGESSKMKYISFKGSTTSGSASTDSYGTRSSTRETPIKELILPSPSSARKAKQLEKRIRTPVTKTLKRVEKQRMSGSLKRFKKHELCSFSSLSRSQKSEKDSSSLGIKRKKVELEKSRKQLKLDTGEWSQNENQGLKPVRQTLDARSYRDLLRSRARKAKVSGRREKLFKWGGNVIGANSSKEVEEGVVESCFSCSKRQRVDDSKQQLFYCNAELGHELRGISLPNVVCTQASMSRSPPKDETAVNDIKDGTFGTKEDDGRELVARLNMELTEEYVSDMQHKESQLDTKTDNEHDACVICGNGGNLLCCDGKGCKRSYHLSCLDPLSNVHPGVWYCISCVKKKIELGVHSVSEKVHSIWDAREVVSDHEVMQRQKQYLVKYQGLAHVHNRWISETRLLLDAPKLVAKFNRKIQAIQWKTEWTVPHRLLQKRLLVFPKKYDKYCHGYNDNNSDCHYEWLVKWTDLGYDQATWELENASFLRSPEALKLIKDFESRHEKAERSSHLPRADEERKGTFSELSEFPFGGLPGVHDRHLSNVNKLREYWHKGQDAVVVDDQERVVNVILFILSLQCDVYRPFLIISTSTVLSVWEAEFSRLAPSANIVVYKGSRDVRNSIRTLEFYNEYGCLMFQVLLSSSDVIVEDLEVLECIGWEAIIVDECQRSRISRHFKQIKILSADMRLLLVTGQIKDCMAGYLNLLSFLDSGFDGISSDGLEIDSNINICTLKERLAQFIAFECKSGSSRFVEYWVPVQLSNVQLEQYCATVLSNSMLLCSCSKSDPADALRDILISIRKCCDHPYLLDQSLKSFVTKDLPIDEYLDVGIKASGKLQLLDKFLLEIKSRGLRVLILFQSLGGCGRYSVGDILDDFVCQRFGKDSYVRIDGGAYSRSKKQAALNMFNNKESGKFVLLIENRACLPSVKLSSVNTVILFDSDWDPLNDLRALQKITIDSHFDQLKVFRLYSSCTVEEKVLILAKEGVILDSNIQNIHRSTCHMLLIWGASYLFNKLDDFHGCSTSIVGSNISSNQSLLNDVLCEVSNQLPCNGENSNPSHCSIILKVQQSGGVYPRNISLLSEVEMQLMDKNEPPVFFWTNLFEGRHPQWKFLSGSSQRIRRKVQIFDNSPRQSEYESDAVRKKCRKVVNNTVDPISLKPRLKDKRKLVAGDKKEKLAGASGNTAGTVSQFLPCSTDNMDNLNLGNDSLAVPPVANDNSRVPEVDIDKSEERRKLHDAKKSAQMALKPEISKLCQILQLPEGVKAMALKFLEYIMNDYNVSWEAVTTLQAFKISLCWTAASFSKHKIDHKESLALAKLHLNYDFKEEEASYIYSKLQKLKKMFACHRENIERVNESNYVRASKSTTSDQQESEGEMQKSFQSHTCSDQLLVATNEQALDSRMAQKNDISNSIRQVLEICSKRMEKLLQKQQKEFQEFYKMRGKEKAKLEEEHRWESALIRTKDSKISVRLDKLRMLDHSFKKKMDEHNRRMEIRWKNIEASQLESRIEEEQLKANRIAWLGETNSGRPIASLGDPPLPYSEFRVDKVQSNKLARDHNDAQNAIVKSMPALEDQNHDGILQSVPSEVPEISPDKVTFCSLPPGTIIIPIESATENDGMELTASERATSSIEVENKSGISSDGHENGAPVSNSEKQSPDRNTLIMPGVRPSEVPQIVLNEVVKGDDPMKMATLSIQPTRECDGTDAVTSERATVSEGRQQNRAVTAICRELPTLALTGTSSSLVQLHTCSSQGSSMPSYQLPLSTTPPSAVHNQANIPASIGTQHHPSNGMHASSRQAQVPRQPPVEDPAELFNFSGMHPITNWPLQPSTGMPVSGSLLRVLDFRSTTTVPESVNDHAQAACLDPLLNEMERIQKDKGQAIKIHEDMKLQLKSDCAKEIEDIRKKYDVLLQDAEIALVQKRKDLDTCYIKVFVNKLLAEALAHKHDNSKVDGSSDWQQATMSTFMNQLFQPSFQQTTQRHAPRLEHSTANSPMTSPPVAPSVQVVNHSSAVLSTSPIRSRSSLTIGPMTSPPVAPSVQVVNHSSAGLSTSPVRSRSSLTIGFTGNLPAGSELRAPAPHLRHSRPSTFVSTSHLPTLPCGVPNQQSPSNPPATSAMPTQPTESYSGIHQPESAIGLQVSNSSLSSLKLAMGINNSPATNLPNPISPLQDLCSSFQPRNPSEQATTGSLSETD